MCCSHRHLVDGDDDDENEEEEDVYMYLANMNPEE